MDPRRRARLEKILNLVPPPNASSDGSEESNDDQDELQHCSRSTSPAPTLDSSFERLNLLESSDDKESLDSENTDLVDENEQINCPLTLVIQEVFPTINNINYDAVPSISSLQSPSTPSLPTAPSMPVLTTPVLSLPITTRSKRKKPLETTVVTKKVKKVPLLQSNYTWKRSTFKHRAELEDVTFDSELGKSALNYFYEFFSPDIIEDILQQSNLYSVQKTGRCANISTEEMKAFLSIKLLMGIVVMPSYLDYWSVRFRYDRVANLMSLKRYQQIRKNLHFCNNENQDSDRYFKVRPVVEKIRQNCLKLQEENRFSIDEMIIPYKGKKAGNRRQYNAKKPRKWGFKVFVRAGVSGLIYDFLLYGGPDTFRYINFTDGESAMGLGEKVVVALCKTIKSKPVIVYYDNFFSSVHLVSYLRSEYGIFSLGTIKSNRLRGCQKLLPDDKVMKKKPRGSYSQYVCNKNKIATVKWMDNKPVVLISSYVDAYPVEKCKRFCKEEKKKIHVDCPQIVKHYNAHMGGVDLADMLVALYRTEMKSKRWPLSIFSQMIDLCVNNAWLKYRRDNKQSLTKILPLKHFRWQIYEELYKKNRVLSGMKKGNDIPSSEKIKEPRNITLDSIRYDQIDHLPTFTKYGRCKYCKTGQTTIFCEKCDSRLCLVPPKRNCFYNYHKKT